MYTVNIYILYPQNIYRLKHVSIIRDADNNGSMAKNVDTLSFRSSNFIW